MKRGSDPNNSPVKIMFFGPWSSGKSYSIVGLLLSGLKVLVMTTDVGGSGMNAVKLALRHAGKEELLDNLYEVVINGDDELQEFLLTPRSFFPDIYTVDLDWVVWDGFGAWQQVDLSERIGGMAVPRAGNKELPQAVEEGLQFEQQQWGMMRNATIRAVHKFCSLKNKETGKIWHKIVTVQEGVKSKKVEAGKDASSLTETHMPLVQGAGGVLMGGAFDLIIRTHEVKETDSKGIVSSKYLYELKGENHMSKNRGFKLPNVMPADMQELWKSIASQLGVVKDAVDTTETETEG